MLQRAVSAGEIRGDINSQTAATVLMILGDGMSWRRAVDPTFDPKAVLPMVLEMVGCLLAKPAAVEHGTEKSR
jgi:TetR/AcrR family transcriptional repressor of uid operon